MNLRIRGKVFAMSNDAETIVEPGSVPQAAEHGPPRRPYEGPQLTEWGSIRELTGSGLAGFDDVNFDQGSEGV
jgi:hypothetical protein